MNILIWQIFGKSGFLEIDFWFSFTGKENEEWEAELEGELNEFEMVSSKGDAEDGSNDPEWENQIEQMLEAEEKEGKQNWKISNIVYSYLLLDVISKKFCVLQNITIYLWII